MSEPLHSIGGPPAPYNPGADTDAPASFISPPPAPYNPEPDQWPTKSTSSGPPTEEKVMALLTFLSESNVGLLTTRNSNDVLTSYQVSLAGNDGASLFVLAGPDVGDLYELYARGEVSLGFSGDGQWATVSGTATIEEDEEVKKKYGVQGSTLVRVKVVTAKFAIYHVLHAEIAGDEVQAWSDMPTMSPPEEAGGEGDGGAHSAKATEGARMMYPPQARMMYPPQVRMMYPPQVRMMYPPQVRMMYPPQTGMTRMMYPPL
jgi:hypothetical protein